MALNVVGNFVDELRVCCKIPTIPRHVEPEQGGSQESRDSKLGSPRNEESCKNLTDQPKTHVTPRDDSDGEKCAC